MREILLPFLRDKVQGQLSAKTDAIRPLSKAVEKLSADLRGLEKRINSLVLQSERLQRTLNKPSGFHGKMTVHEAWASHPGVRDVFAERHLPHCDSCPVGADERLEEAAFGYAIDLEELLKDLNALC